MKASNMRNLIFIDIQIFKKKNNLKESARIVHNRSYNIYNYIILIILLQNKFGFILFMDSI